MYHLRRATIVVAFLAALAALAFITWFVPRVLNPTPPSPADQERDNVWVKSSPYWLDRQACMFFSICGLHHLRWDDPTKPRDLRVEYQVELELKRRALRRRQALDPRDGQSESVRGKTGLHTKAEQLRDVPDFVLKHAPLVHLYSREHFWPSDIAEHVRHMAPYSKKKPLDTAEPVDLDNMYDLNNVPGFVFLTSVDNVEQRPDWLFSNAGEPNPYPEDQGDGGKPDADESHVANEAEHFSGYEDTTWWDIGEETALRRISAPQDFDRQQFLSKHRRRLAPQNEREPKSPPTSPNLNGHKPDVKGYSAAPAVLVVVDKGSGIVDAFWFFFYSYNLGQTVLKMRFGNHVGDWEHCMIRFENGVPRAMFLSEHEGGQAYAWTALEKKLVNSTVNGVSEAVERPVIYSAVGSHAMYAFPGDHAYVLPFNLLKDQTDRGPLWDPSLNSYAYFYDHRLAPPPPEEDEDGDDLNLSLDESRPYPVSLGVVEALDDIPLRQRDGDNSNPITLTPASSNPDAPTSWFHFEGPWGDELYSLGDDRQWRLFGQYHYVTGPMGPKFKNLGREMVCQKTRCRILFSIDEGRRSSWHD